MLVQPLELESAVPTLARHTVLIVDDEEAISEPLRIRLQRLGFATLTASSGRQAMELARRERPDCITLDLGLPDIDGFTLCERLVDEDATSEIPVIIVSGNDNPDIVRRARAAGCHFFVRKPFDPNALLALIRQAIDAGLDEE
jgi:DNA-binding response OmpR family regulator